MWSTVSVAWSCISVSKTFWAFNTFLIYCKVPLEVFNDPLLQHVGYGRWSMDYYSTAVLSRCFPFPKSTAITQPHKIPTLLLHLGNCWRETSWDILYCSRLVWLYLIPHHTTQHVSSYIITSDDIWLIVIPKNKLHILLTVSL